MIRRLLPTLASASLAALLLSGFSEAAHAEIYTWVDASGAVNVTNLPPPKTARVTHVVPDSPRPPVTAADAAAAAARASQEAQALSDRVRELELQVEQARAQPPAPPMVYAAAPAPPPVVQYFVEAPQQPANNGCDAGWNGCGFTPGSFYPPTVVVFGGPRIRPNDAFHRQHFQGQWPVMGAGGVPRGGGPQPAIGPRRG